MRTPGQGVVKSVEEKSVVTVSAGHSAHPGNIGQRGRGGRVPVLLLLLSLLRCGLSGDGTVPLGNPSEVKEEIASQPLLVVGNLALSGSDGN